MLPGRAPNCIAALAGAGLAFVLPAAAHACTVCDSKTGRAVRAGIFDGHFLQHLLLTLLPFPVLAAAVVLCRCAVPYLLPKPGGAGAAPHAAERA